MTAVQTPHLHGEGSAPASGTVFDEFADWVLSNRFATATQIHVQVADHRPVDLASGHSLGAEPCRIDDLIPTYCMSKPLLPIMVGYLLDSGMSLDDTVDAAAAALGMDVRPRTTIGEVLVHRAGLAHPRAAVWRMYPESQRHVLLATVAPVPTNAYSEIAGGLLIEALIEERFGVPAAEWLTAKVLEPLGVESSFVVDPARVAAVRHRVRPSVGGLPARPLPLLSELLPGQLAEIRPAFSALAEARGVGRILAGMLSVQRGHTVAGLPSPASVAEMALDSGRYDDEVLGRPARFVGGFLTDLNDHIGPTPLHSSSFGVLGGMNNALGVVDPNRELVAVLVTNGVIVDDASMFETRRRFVEASCRWADDLCGGSTC